MAYRTDKDLEFLSKVSAEDMKPLTDILTQNFNQNLDKRNPEDPAYWTYVAEQIQLYGGDTLVNVIFRFGDGVLYREVLTDVCEVCKVEYEKAACTADIEAKLVKEIFAQAWSNLDINQKRVVLASAGIPFMPSLVGDNSWYLIAAILNSNTLLANLFLRDFIFGMVMSVVGKAAVTFVASRGMLMWAGPLGLGLSAVPSLSGTAYRITIPACLTVAMLRKQVGMTPEDILARQKQKEREDKIKRILMEIIKEEKRIINIYVYCYKILELKKVEEMYEDILRQNIFGITSVDERNKDVIDKLINQESFSSIIKKNIHSGNNEEYLRKLLDYWIETIDLMPEGIIAIGPSGSASNQTIVSEFNKTVAEL